MIEPPLQMPEYKYLRFVGAAQSPATPTVACSRAQRPATHTNGTAGTAGHTSCPYKWVGFVGAAHSPAAPDIAICRGGWWLSRPYKCPAYKYLRFVGAAQSPAAPTNDPHINQAAAPSYSSGHSLQPMKERWGGLGHLPKITLLRGKILVSNPLVERL